MTAHKKLLALIITLALAACVAEDVEPNSSPGAAEGAIASVACLHAPEPEQPCADDQILSPTLNDRGCIIAWSCAIRSSNTSSSLTCTPQETPTCSDDQMLVEEEDSDGCITTRCEEIIPCEPGATLLEASFELSSEARRNLATSVCDSIEGSCQPGALFQTSEDPEEGTLTCNCTCKE